MGTDLQSNLPSGKPSMCPDPREHMSHCGIWCTNSGTILSFFYPVTQLHILIFFLGFPEVLECSFCFSLYSVPPFIKWPEESQHFKGRFQNEYVAGISMTVSQPGDPKACCKIDVSISHAQRLGSNMPDCPWKKLVEKAEHLPGEAKNNKEGRYTVGKDMEERSGNWQQKVAGSQWEMIKSIWH